MTTTVGRSGSSPSAARACARSAVRSNVAISRLMGMPTVRALRSGVSGKAVATTDANRAPTRFAIPGLALASWITTGIRRLAAARYTGVHTYPPTPTTTVACCASKIRPAWRTAADSRRGRRARSRDGLRGRGTRSISSRGTPACGTSRVSMPEAVPTAHTVASARNCCTASAMASRGLMCPAVPPPASTTRADPARFCWWSMSCVVVILVPFRTAGSRAAPTTSGGVPVAWPARARRPPGRPGSGCPMPPRTVRDPHAPSAGPGRRT